MVLAISDLNRQHASLIQCSLGRSTDSAGFHQCNVTLRLILQYYKFHLLASQVCAKFIRHRQSKQMTLGYDMTDWKDSTAAEQIPKINICTVYIKCFKSSAFLGKGKQAAKQKVLHNWEF